MALMRTLNPSVDDLHTFVLVARTGSFSRAAEHTQASPSSVSASISRLESRLGARLLQRTTRKVTLTQEGRELMSRCVPLLDDFDALSSLFLHTQAPLTGCLRVDLPLGMATGAVMDLLPAFLARHPDLTIDMFSTDRRIDLIAEGVDCVVRAGLVGDDSLVCRPLGELPLVNVASRGYVDVHGEPLTLDDLARHFLVDYAPNPAPRAARFEYLAGQTTHLLPMRHWVTVNNSAAYKAACRAGLGIVQVPLSAVESDIATGDLVQVMRGHRPAAMPINLLYPHRRNLPRRVRIFGDWLAEVVATSMGSPHPIPG